MYDYEFDLLLLLLLLSPSLHITATCMHSFLATYLTSLEQKYGGKGHHTSPFVFIKEGSQPPKFVGGREELFEYIVSNYGEIPEVEKVLKELMKDKP